MKDFGSGIIEKTSGGKRLRFKKIELRIAIAKGGDVDVVLTQQFEVDIAKVGGLPENGVALVTKAASGDDGGQVVAGVVGGISEVAANHDGGVIEHVLAGISPSELHTLADGKPATLHVGSEEFRLDEIHHIYLLCLGEHMRRQAETRLARLLASSR